MITETQPQELQSNLTERINSLLPKLTEHFDGEISNARTPSIEGEFNLTTATRTPCGGVRRAFWQQDSEAKITTIGFAAVSTDIYKEGVITTKTQHSLKFNNELGQWELLCVIQNNQCPIAKVKYLDIEFGSKVLDEIGKVIEAVETQAAGY